MDRTATSAEAGSASVSGSKDPLGAAAEALKERWQLTDSRAKAEHAIATYLDALLRELPGEATKAAAGPICGEFEEVWASLVPLKTPDRFEPLETISENAAKEATEAFLRSLRGALGVEPA